jgi:PleD family two-component response regulator
MKGIQLEYLASAISLLPLPQSLTSQAEKPRRNTRQKMGSSPNTPLEQIRVIIADDHPVVREGLSSILSALEDV